MSAVGVADHSYLGREFLTWIWFRCEVEGGEFDLPSGRLDLIVEDNLQFVGHDDDTTVASVKGGCPTLRAESASALASGMTLRRAKLHCARDEREWTFTLDAETLDIKSLKVPAVEAEDPLEQLTERLQAAEEMRDALEEMFAEFLSIRLYNEWTKVEAERMRDWVRVKLTKAEADHNRFNAGTPSTAGIAAQVLEEAARHAEASVESQELADELDDEDLDATEDVVDEVEESGTEETEAEEGSTDEEPDLDDESLDDDLEDEDEEV